MLLIFKKSRREACRMGAWRAVVMKIDDKLTESSPPPHFTVAGAPAWMVAGTWVKAICATAEPAYRRAATKAFENCILTVVVFL